MLATKMHSLRWKEKDLLFVSTVQQSYSETMHLSQQFEKNIQIKPKTIFSDILDKLARNFNEKLKS